MGLGGAADVWTLPQDAHDEGQRRSKFADLPLAKTHGGNDDCSKYGKSINSKWRNREPKLILREQGIESQPGPFFDWLWSTTRDPADDRVRIVSRNNGGLRNGLGEVTAGLNHIIGVQEGKLAETDVKFFEDDARNAGYWCEFGENHSIKQSSSNTEEVRGRQVALLVKQSFSSAKPVDVTPDDDEHVALLKRSGRWLERLVVTDGEHRHIMVAVLYGISGAPSSPTKGCDNELLISAAMARMAQFEGTPYFLLSDLNTDPDKSPVVCAAVRNGIAKDIINDYHDGQAPPTFNKARKIQPGMGGKGTSRIDVIFTNTAAAHTVTGVDYLYAGTSGKDHVAVSVSVGLKSFDDTVEVLERPVNLSFVDYDKLKGAELQEARQKDEDFFNKIWQLWVTDFEEAERNDDPEGMHKAWCGAAEQYLFSRRQLRIRDLPRDRPRRGQVMPRTKVKATNKISLQTGLPRDTAAEHVADLTGLVHDIRHRLARITELKPGQVDGLSWYVDRGSI